MTAPLSTASGWSPQRVVVVGALWTALACNWPLWRLIWQLEEFGLGSRMTLLAVLALGTAALLCVLLAPLAWARTVRPALIVVFACAALIAHFIGTYGVVINPSMMRNAMQTDVREVRDLLGLGFLASLLVLGVLPAAVLMRVALRPQRWSVGLRRNAVLLAGSLAVVALGLFASFADMASLMRGRPDVRYMITPLNGFYSLAAQARGPSGLKPAGPPQPVATDASVSPLAQGQRPRLLLLVVGETARADRFSLNGYARSTSPELARRDVVSFSDVTSCGTDTASSLPCMFSLLPRDEYVALDRPQENLLDVLQRSGLAVLWIDNQSGCKGLCQRIPNALARDPAVGAPPLPAALCRGDECFDLALLHGLEHRIAALDPARRARGIVVVLHQMGSHGPAYYLRTPDERKPFQPECRSVSLRSCDKAALDNAYDNTIAYTDHVLARAIDWLETQSGAYDAALLYISDHGESLGENQLYLHGMPYRLAPREQTHVPMVAWWPTHTARASGITLECARRLSARPLTHSHLAHTVLAWMDVRTASLRKDLDAFAACRERP
ncbi:MAG TPA: phosphoethanolamine--lipid A transferase [Burkholderiaceae bacterium]|nr:phosphoethanolamine--lipid A transferase [Burkholderiaceae bacterium]